MFEVAAVVESGKSTQRAEAADRSPADKFNEAVGRIGVGSDKHGAAGIFAVVKGEEKAAPGVPLGFVIGSEMKRATLELRQADENAEKIAEVSERFECAIGERADVGGKSNAEDVERKNFSGSVREADQVNGTGAIGKKSLHRGFRAVVGEIAQERISGAERQESERDALSFGIAGENSVENFVRGAIAADREKPPIALRISFARKLQRVAGPGGGDHVNVEAFFAKASQCRAGELRRLAATSSGIDDGDETALVG